MKESTVQHLRNGGVAHLSMILISTKTLHTWTDVATTTGNNCIKKRFFPQKDHLTIYLFTFKVNTKHQNTEQYANSLTPVHIQSDIIISLNLI